MKPSNLAMKLALCTLLLTGAYRADAQLMNLGALGPVKKVEVVNPPTKPLPVTGGVAITNTPTVQLNGAVKLDDSVPVRVSDANHPAQFPYQYTDVVADSSQCGGSCNFSFPAVPAGYRLVITDVSAQLGPTATVVVLEGGQQTNGLQTTLFVPVPYAGSAFLAAPVTFYVKSGDSPSARIFRPDSRSAASELVTLVGYLVPTQ